MAVVAGDTVYILIRQVPEFPLQWWPNGEAYSTKALADAAVAAKTDARYQAIGVTVDS